MISLECVTPTIEEVRNKCLENLDVILDNLGIDYNRGSGRYFFECPIHGSDNYSSLTIYDSGVWLCFTRQCHLKYSKGLFGFVQAVKKCSFNEAINFCLKLIGTQSKITHNTRKRVRPSLIPKEKVHKLSNPNIEFYLRRGYSKEILEKYDIFLCLKRSHALYGRIIFPIYDDSWENAIGFVGRTLNPHCSMCNKFHLQTRPCPRFPAEKIAAEKWLNSRGFARNRSLFNFWFAKDEIKKSKEVILVEGQGDVLKLEMAGIHNSLGIFGTILTREQEEKLINSGASKIFIATDSDKAGEEANSILEKQLQGKFEVTRLKPTQKDFGEMNVSEIIKYFSSI